eukprot:966121-Prorocentrum_minimum.AAC.2
MWIYPRRESSRAHASGIIPLQTGHGRTRAAWWGCSVSTGGGSSATWRQPGSTGPSTPSTHPTYANRS